MIPALIDKQDNSEIIRDQIALVLANEVASQMALAVLASRDPQDWNLKVYTEHHNPIEQYINSTPDPTPVINVQYDNSFFDKASSDMYERQTTMGAYIIDCYGYGVAGTDGGTGQVPGDRTASIEAQRAARLVRNILMADEYRNLGLAPTIAWDRWFQSTEMLHADKDHNTVQNVSADRLTLQVSFNEFSPQVIPGTLELVTVDIKRAEDGQVIAEADFDFTP